MSGYAAVNDAFRFVEKQDTLLKQVIRMQAEKVRLQGTAEAKKEGEASGANSER
ncbi:MULTISPECIES: hypothetical protein [Roseomonadaceae]|jgi:ribosomal protein L4|uniref:Ribosomal protein L4 n=1 Tax=Muricoccus pecuniae TaxID=693023 RepID=A0A840Y7X6_9PROT|nr:MULTISPECIES: hypothetical protein [Roseomonas]MBB5696010.1 ribosomal protein L4 [Roseomonas pecuniae]USQ74562.1 hypothetical protein NF552_25025 [Roseomonas mucosa]